MPEDDMSSLEIIGDALEARAESCPVCGAETASDSCWYPTAAQARRGKRRPYAPGCPAREQDA